jgi:hypothetical protein
VPFTVFVGIAAKTKFYICASDAGMNLLDNAYLYMALMWVCAVSITLSLIRSSDLFIYQYAHDRMVIDYVMKLTV